MNNALNGFFNDNGIEINPDLIPKPDQPGEKEFQCFAYVSQGSHS